MCQHGLVNPTGSLRLAFAATVVVVVVAVGGAVATAASTVAAAGTVAGEVVSGEKVTDPAEHETHCGLDDPWPCLFHL